MAAVAWIFCAEYSQAEGTESACRELIPSGLKQYSIRTDSGSYLTSVFDRYCDESGSTKSSGLWLGLDIVVKTIPVTFTGSYSSNEEAVRNFCKTYAGQARGHSDQERYEEKIVDRAYDSFDACTAIAATGVILLQSDRRLRGPHKVKNVMTLYLTARDPVSR